MNENYDIHTIKLLLLLYDYDYVIYNVCRLKEEKLTNQPNKLCMYIDYYK